MFYGSELAYVILAPLAIVGVIVLAIVALAGRSEPDARGDRAHVLFLSLVSFVALFTLLFALVNVAATVTDMVLGDSSGECTDPYSPECFEGGLSASSLPSEFRTRSLLNAGGVALAAGAVLVFHRKRSRDLLGGAGFAGSPGARTFTAYLYAVAFTALVIFLGAAAIGLPALVRTIAPGLTALESTSSEREAALTDLVPSLVAAGGAVVIYLMHGREAHRLRAGD